MSETADIKKPKRKLTTVSIIHYVRLVYRFALFVVTLVIYIYDLVRGYPTEAPWLRYPYIMWAVWGIFMTEMFFRFFPSKLESPGCQKQFAKNLIKTGNTDIIIEDNNATMLVGIIWIAGNAVFGILYKLGILNDDMMVLLCLAYSVGDLICILFFCPFQSWFLKNKCCTTCRIYNWDYAMMFTPLIFVRGFYAWSLLAVSLALMLRWEITFYRHPERFSIRTNAYLRCENCNEKLCHHKNQLHSLWKRTAELTAEKIRLLKNI
ncbi:MAG: hypothetical protein IJU43_10310 [Lachnospiraceae bacterium]|nr:hypothetical protein [Lachnospiraceae bacterium]